MRVAFSRDRALDPTVLGPNFESGVAPGSEPKERAEPDHLEVIPGSAVFIYVRVYLTNTSYSVNLGLTMLMIRFQRIGRKNDPAFRIAVLDKASGPKAGKYVDLVGTYNPKTKAVTLKPEAIKKWMSQGAQVSPSLHNLLVKEGVIEGAKNASVVSKVNLEKNIAKKAAEDAAAAEKAEAEALKAAEAAKAEAEQAEAATETVAEETVAEAPVAEEITVEAPSEVVAEAEASEVAEEETATAPTA